MRSGLAASRAEIRELHGRATAAEARVQLTEESLSTLRETLERERTEARRALETAAESQSATSAAEARVRQAQEEVERLSQQAELTAVQLFEKDAIIQGLKSQLTQGQELGKILSATSAKVDELEVIRGALAQEKADLAGELARVKAELEEAGRANLELKTTKQKLEEEVSKLSENAEKVSKSGKKRARTEPDEEQMEVDEGHEDFEEAEDQFAEEVAEKVDPKKLTKNELKGKITAAGFGHLVLEIRNPTKGQLVEIYEKHVAKK